MGTVIDKSMQSYKKIYSVVMKLNQFLALHFFANCLYLQNIRDVKKQCL